MNIRDTWLTTFRQRGQRWDDLTHEERLDVVVATNNEVVTQMWNTTNHFSSETNFLLDIPYGPSEELAAQVGFVVQPVYPDPPRETVDEVIKHDSGR